MAVHLRQIALLRHPKNAKHQHIELLHLVVPLSGGEGARHSPSALVLRDDEQLLLEMARFAPLEDVFFGSNLTAILEDVSRLWAPPI